MRTAAIALLLLASAGCTDDNPLPDIYTPLAGRVTALEGRSVSVTASEFADEVTARKRGDTDTLAAAAAATEARIAKLATADALSAESARATAAEAAITAKIGAVKEPRMIGPNGEDLGRWLGPSLAYVEKADGVLDFAAPSVPGVLFAGLNCTGAAYVSGAALPQGTLRQSATGTMFITTGRMVSAAFQSVADGNGCRASAGTDQALPVKDTKMANIAFAVDQVHMELRPVAP
jgi:hypothetical protein